VHRDARAEQHDRVERGEPDVEPVDPGRRPRGQRVSQVQVREDERREQHDVADQEEQEALQAQLARFGVELVDLALVRVRDGAVRHRGYRHG